MIIMFTATVFLIALAILLVYLASVDRDDVARCVRDGVCVKCRGSKRLSGGGEGTARRFTYPCPYCTS